MKTVTNGFKEQIAQLGREIDFKFFLHTNDKILTEDGKFLMTEDNMQLVVEQFDEEEIDEVITSEDIFNVSIINKGNILSTMMKEIDFEVSKDLRIGDIIGCQFGLKVNGNYEYVDYGKYMIYSKEFNEDTKTYNYVAFDRMLLTMQEASSDFLKTLEETTLASAISNICNQVGLSFTATTQELEDYPNLSKEINEGTFTDMEITYRDVLDMICQALGLSMIVEEKQLILKALNKTIVDSFDKQYLKDTNVSFGEKYMINSVVLSRSEDNDTIYRRDEQSITENGVHEFKIKDNLIMLYDDREDYIDEIFNQLNGLEYYVNDFKSTGITYLDWLDFYNVTIGDKTYKCLMLNDEIKISQGLEENIYTEEPEETTTDYKTSSKTDKEVSFIVDKQNGKINAKVSKDEFESTIEQTNNKINLKVSKGEVINEINLDESGASINANKVNIQASDVLNILAGNTINLTSKDIAINSTNFQVDKDGNVNANNIIARNGTFEGGNINLIDNGGQSYYNSRFIIKNQYNNNNYSYLTSGQLFIQNGDYHANIQSDASGIEMYIGKAIGGNYTYIGSRGMGYVIGTSEAFGVDSNGETFVRDGKYINWGPYSLERLKKNIFKTKINALDIINKCDIYDFNYNIEDDKEKKHIGLIIGEKYNTPKEVISKNGDSIDIYSMTSVLWKAIQEQQEMIEKLQSKIEKLEKESDK